MSNKDYKGQEDWKNKREKLNNQQKKEDKN
jgi:hypothetical protein